MRFLHNLKKKFIGDRQFYLYVCAIAIPMILQNMVTNFVSLLDNIMVGQIGTMQMSGVAIANQFTFVFNITIFGTVAGAGIFSSQFFRKGDADGQRYTVRFRLIICTLLALIGILVFYFFGDNLIGLYINEEATASEAAATLGYGRTYLNIMLISMIPFAIGQVYANILRECEETRVPMAASVIAVVMNVILDYGLIFGNLGMPELGVAGAAIATVAAKIVEAGIIIIWAHLNTDKIRCIGGLYKGFSIPGGLSLQMLRKSMPLMLNEFLWSYGMATLTQCYAMRGLDVVAAQNISSTITNIFGVIYIQLGSSIAIIVGQKLGAGRFEEAKDTDNKLIAFSFLVCLAVCLFVMLPLASWFPNVYNTEPEIRALATYMITINATAMPMWALTNAFYFTLRSGGNVMITVAFDSIYTWVILLPILFVFAKFTTVGIHILIIIATYMEVIKIAIGLKMVCSNKWMRTIVN